jgi:aminoglycoside phosphotransferase family enzyme/predicted kinase
VASDNGEIVRWLSTPAAYPHGPASVELVETHISCVFLAGDQVYKLKKPVRYDFLDFSTVELREHACCEELRLNRRLAPQAYVDVVPITRTAAGELQIGGLQIGGQGQPVDWLVHMRRLPTELTLEALHQRGELRPEQIDRLAGVLVDFYRSLVPLPITAEEYRQRVESHVRGNRRELMSVAHHLPPSAIERVHAFQLQLLKLQPEVFDARARTGKIVEGHGDLRPEHICLTEPPAIFDCIEFSADFRSLDVVDELAFLAAECDFLGADWVGSRLFARYCELSGDRPPEVLLDFYKSYRACVRAKVAALRADQVQGQECEAATAEALRHLQLADKYAVLWSRPLVLIVGGLSGTGKSTLAAAIAEALGAEPLRTDVIRKELFSAADSEELYRPESRERVYDEMFARAKQLHSDRISVVLDGTFGSTAAIRGAVQIASGPRALLLAIECVCPPEVARERISRRRAAGRDPSDARPELHEQQRQSWQPWPTDVPQMRIDTQTGQPEQVRRVLRELARLCREGAMSRAPSSPS